MTGRRSRSARSFDFVDLHRPLAARQSGEADKQPRRAARLSKTAAARCSRAKPLPTFHDSTQRDRIGAS